MSAVLEKINDLPEGWKWISLGEYVENHDAARIPVSTNEREKKKGDFPYYGASGIIDSIDGFTHEGEFVLIGEDGANLLARSKPIAFIAKGQFWVNNHAHVLKCKDGLPNAYFCYYINSIRLNQYVTGTAQPKLNQNNLNKIPIPVAPPEQQNRIVAKIEELFSHIDAGIEALKKAKQLLKQYRQSVLKAAVTGELTKEWREENKDKLEPATQLLEKIEVARNAWIEVQVAEDNGEARRLKTKHKKHVFEELDTSLVPVGWISVSLTKLCLLVVDCHNKTAPYVDSGTPLIRTSNIRDGVVNFEEKMKYVNQETYEFWSRRCPPEPGDILFTREAPMGESAIIPENIKVCMGQRMMLLRVIHDLVDVNYLHIALMAPLFLKRIQGFKVGVGVQHLRVGDVEKAAVELPPFAEQKEIVRVATERLDAISRLEDEIDHQLVKLERYKQSVLATAFSGRLANEI